MRATFATCSGQSGSELMAESRFKALLQTPFKDARPSACRAELVAWTSKLLADTCMGGDLT